MIVWLSYFWIKSERLGGRGVGEPRPHPETKCESRSTDPSFAISGFPLRGNDETERENLEDLGRADISRRRTEPIASATPVIPAFAGMTGVENGNDCRKSRPYSNFFAPFAPFAPLRLCVKFYRWSAPLQPLPNLLRRRVDFHAGALFLQRHGDARIAVAPAAVERLGHLGERQIRQLHRDVVLTTDLAG